MFTLIPVVKFFTAMGFFALLSQMSYKGLNEGMILSIVQA